jgi:hypothetical protein
MINAEGEADWLIAKMFQSLSTATVSKHKYYGVLAQDSDFFVVQNCRYDHAQSKPTKHTKKRAQKSIQKLTILDFSLPPTGLPLP